LAARQAPGASGAAWERVRAFFDLVGDGILADRRLIEGVYSQHPKSFTIE
jgi:hypothetical protein